MSFTDPIFGAISDKIRTRFGRRRVFFIIGIVPIVITFTPLWLAVEKVNASGSNELFVFVYYLVIYCLFNTIYSMVITPYSELMADMTHDYKERVSLSAFRMGFSQFSAILSTYIAPLLLTAFSYSSKAYAVMAILFVIVYALVWIVVFTGTRELPLNEFTAMQKKSSFTEGLKNFISVFKNKSFLMHLGLYLFAFSALDIIMGLNTYFIKDVLDKPYLVSCVGVMWLVQVCVLPIYVKIAHKYGKTTSYKIGGCIWILAMLLLLLLTPHTTNGFTLTFAYICVGIGLSPCYVIPMSMLSFVAEVDVLISKQRRAGVYVGAMSLVRKFSQGLIILPGVGIVLTLIGYNAALAHQSIDTLTSLRYLFIFIPVVFICIGLFFSTRFKINPKNFEILKNEINRLENGGSKEDVNPNTKAVCEILTGQKYSKLYKS